MHAAACPENGLWVPERLIKVSPINSEYVSIELSTRMVNRNKVIISEAPLNYNSPWQQVYKGQTQFESSGVRNMNACVCGLLTYIFKKHTNSSETACAGVDTIKLDLV